MAAGTWGEWVSGVGTVLAVFAAIGIATWEAARQRRREEERRLEEERAQARSVHVWTRTELEGRDEEGLPRWRQVFHFYNASTSPVFDLMVVFRSTPAGPLLEDRGPLEPETTMNLSEAVLPKADPGHMETYVPDGMRLELLYWAFQDAEGRWWNSDGKRLTRKR